ncbi:MAG: DUF397 domain-containing protein [Pseudonocardiales bacterium]|nr:DUF397 domain-containing protein [Pseudonocardiales bacterium]PZS32413.1 MAG: DUF397 domain-containing protein [Pseudonocardiales bacterium]
MEQDALSWVRSTFSTNGPPECVEVARMVDGGVAVRNSREPDAAPLIFTAAEWVAFVAGMKDGGFDRL